MISITVVTYNRLEYTKLTLKSLRENTKLDHEIIVIDNGSDDGTVEWLATQHLDFRISKLRYNNKNLYPGAATNIGWDKAHKDTKILVRADNDLEFKPGWDQQVVKAFEEFPKLGQLGLINEEYRYSPSANRDLADYICRGRSIKLLAPFTMYKTIGGPCAVPVEFFREKKIRWDEKTWMGKVRNEDWDYSVKIQEAGALVRTLYDPFVKHIGFGDMQKYYGYYYKSYRDRGLRAYFQQLVSMEKAGKIVNGRVIED